VDVLLTLPFVIYYIYFTNTVSVDPVSSARATLIYTVTVVVYYSSGAVSYVRFQKVHSDEVILCILGSFLYILLFITALSQAAHSRPHSYSPEPLPSKGK
jgi:hypothetical protein